MDVVDGAIKLSAGAPTPVVPVVAAADCMPVYASAASAGADLRAHLAEPHALQPMERLLVPTGVRVALPEGFEAQVRPRSGLSSRYGITVINAPGTIDADYRGEIMVPLVNLSTETFVIEPGMRIAQMVVAPVARATFVEADHLPATERGSGGFGSTGSL